MLKGLKKIKTEVVCPPKVGEIIEGILLDRGRSALFVDLGPKGIGIIFGRELFEAKHALKGLEIGDKLTAKVTDLETEDGYRELSLIEASQELAWKDLIAAKASGEPFEVQVKSANKGGLICALKTVPGFLPASQLLPEHYPKVDGADPSKIASELQKMVGEKITVKVLDVNPSEGKLILSEKATKKEKVKEQLVSFQKGDEVEGEISGVTSFGAFISLNDGLEGLIPASEISDKEGVSPAEILKIGQKVKAKITEIASDKIYLSLK